VTGAFFLALTSVLVVAMTRIRTALRGLIATNHEFITGKVTIAIL
jgi:hypothetical protein